jgi:hypothetical protein
MEQNNQTSKKLRIVSLGGIEVTRNMHIMLMSG